MSNELFTVGHSTHDMAHFIDLLKQHSVNVVCDVRSQPYSEYNPQFNLDVLKNVLRENAITYIFLGKELGVRSENPNCYIGGEVQYNCLANEPLFRRGIERLCRGMEEYTVALMCAEKDPITCHRMILVCRKMRSLATQIKHILADGTIETNTQAERRLRDSLGIHPDLLRGESQSIEDAYDKQGQKIAYVKKDQAIAG